MKIKNSIIILGNGFDIAHGIKTQYSDFSIHLIETIIIPELIKSREFKDYNNDIFKPDFLKTFIEQRNVFRLETHLDNIIYRVMRNELSILKDYLFSNTDYIKNIISNEFLGKLYSNDFLNWFNIENSYFEELVNLKNVNKQKPSNPIIQRIDNLNNEFEQIKIYFHNYLHTLNLCTISPVNLFLKSILSIKETHQCYIINFNYTDTIEEYLKPYLPYNTVKVNYIHGSLKEGNIIFGYGNDQDTDYQEIKDTGIDNYMKFFKTFDYLSDNKYNNLYKEAIEKFDEYEVHVIGHSLSLSDKTLLKEVLDSEKCKKIHLYKREDLFDKPILMKEEMNKLFYSLSRIISSDRKLRKIVKPFESSTIFPFKASQ